MEQEVLEFINGVVRNNNGTKVTLKSKLSETHLDSLGYLILLTELEAKYRGFNQLSEAEDPFVDIDYTKVIVEDIVKLCVKG